MKRRKKSVYLTKNEITKLYLQLCLFVLGLIIGWFLNWRALSAVGGAFVLLMGAFYLER